MLVDTNVLLRSADCHHAQHAAAERALLHYRPTCQLTIFSQNIYEFWVAATRPEANNGLGFDHPTALNAIEDLEADFHLIAEVPSLFGEWKALITRTPVRGKVAHDARLVAGMNLWGIKEILTFNDQDFQRFPGITPINPLSVPQ
jgi:predicted nucleic acid-binding protein